MPTKRAGYATDDGEDGADYWLLHYGRLPDYYVRGETAKLLGWRPRTGNLHEVMPDRMIGGDVYENANGKLPSSSWREWYEADINYKQGWRNRDRVVFSNDGLIFITHDHYETFIEVTK